MKKLLIAIAIIFIFLGSVEVISVMKRQPAETGNKNKKLHVIASFYSMYFFSKEIAKDNAIVTNLTPGGVEPHDYEPTAKQIADIEKSDILIINGGVEPWAENFKDTLKSKNVDIVVTGETLLTKDMDEEGKTEADPHIWLSPVIAKKQVEKISKAFIKHNPENTKQYEINAQLLNQKLDNLNEKYKKQLANCATRDIITSHTAFAYLADAYGLKQISIAGLSPEEEPSGKQLAEVAEFARKNNIKYIFFESLVSPKLSETIAREIGASTLVLDPIEGISDDGIQAGENYFTVMEDNLKNLTIALQCTQ